MTDDSFRIAMVCACGEHGFIGLTKAHVAFFDVEDAHLIAGTKWRLLDRKTSRYAGCKNDTMHRILLGVTSGTIDHIDGDGLNNRRSNLRQCSHSDNMRNRNVHRKSSGVKYKGVFFNKKGTFVARILVERKLKHLGTFHCAEDAATAYDFAALHHYGEFARTNAMMGLLP